jgi:hypothetical protein
MNYTLVATLRKYFPTRDGFHFKSPLFQYDECDLVLSFQLERTHVPTLQDWILLALTHIINPLIKSVPRIQAIAVVFFAFIRKVFSSNLGRDNNYPDESFSWVC